MVINNFYDASFLKQEGYPIADITKNEKGITHWVINADVDLIQKDLDEFHDNKVLQDYIKNGICELRKCNRKHWQKINVANRANKKVSGKPENSVR